MCFNDSGILQMLNIIQQMFLWEIDSANYKWFGQAESAVFVYSLSPDGALLGAETP